MPLARLPPLSPAAGGGRTLWPGKASSTGALVWPAPRPFECAGWV